MTAPVPTPITPVESDYLTLGKRLQAKLEQEWPEIRVLRARKMDDALVALQGDLAIHVIHAGDHVAPASPGTTIQGVAQIWMTVLAVKFGGADLEGSQHDEIAGPHIAKLLSVLTGWQPGGGFTSFQRVNGPSALDKGSYTYYPFTWMAAATIKGRR